MSFCSAPTPPGVASSMVAIVSGAAARRKLVEIQRVGGLAPPDA
jgi:uncharacterized protein YggU (UPF0235/DUF167 family)